MIDNNNKLKALISKTLSTIEGKDRAIYGILSTIFFITLMLVIGGIFNSHETLKSLLNTNILATLLGISLGLFLSPPGVAHRKLIFHEAAEELKPALIESIDNSIKECLDLYFTNTFFESIIKEIKKVSDDKNMNYRIEHIKGDVYDSSINILDNIKPMDIKIVMKAEEFPICEDVSQSSQKWFDFLNDYVSTQTGRKYTRIVSINPRNVSELETNKKWIEKMIKFIKKKRVNRATIRLYKKEITLSCVLMDYRCILFGFLGIDDVFSTVVKIDAGNEDEIIRGISEWFNRKYLIDNSIIIYENGQIYQNNLDKLFKEISEEIS